MIRSRRFMLVSILATSLVLLAGCGGAPAPAPQATPTPVVTTSGQAIDIVPQGFAKGELPHSLDAIQDDADQMVAAAAGAEWTKVDTEMDAIERDWKTFRGRPEAGQLPQDQMGAIDDAVHGLRETVAGHDTHSTMRGANNLAALLYILAETYHPDLPPRLGLLMVHERNLILDAQENDMVAADETLTRLQTTWQEVRDGVVSQGGSEVAQSFDQAVARQLAAEKAGDSKALESEARQSLPLVQRMEGLGW